MKTLILTICITFLFFLNVKAQISYHIYGTIDRNDVDKIYFISGYVYVDSVIVKKGKFDFKGSYSSPCVTMMRTYPAYGATKVILDNGEYNIKIDSHLKAVIETNSVNHNLWINWVLKQTVANKKAKDSLVNDYMIQVEQEKYNLAEHYITKYNEIKISMLNFYKKLVMDHRDCYIIPYLLGGQDILTKENFGSTFEMLNPEVKGNEWGQKFKATLETKATPKPDHNMLNILMLGSMAKYFDTKLIDDKSFNFSSLKGKWILLDFWASWCAPCRAELPELLKTYEQFKDKNFVISYVSVDKTTLEWQKALIEDKTPPFIHSFLGESGNSDEFKFYHVDAIPTNFLINPEGRIVALNLRGDELFNNLARVIK